MQFKGNYQNGQKHGKVTEWYENGQMKSEENYQNGQKHGKVTEWFENGDISRKTYFIYGEEDMTTALYDNIIM